MPELSKDDSFYSDERTQDLMKLLNPIFEKNGNLIFGSSKYIKKWFSCINNPAWK